LYLLLKLQLRNVNQKEHILPSLPGNTLNAIDLFKDAYSKTKKADKNSRTELVFMIAECYRLTNDPKNAETWYKLAVKSSFSKPGR